METDFELSFTIDELEMLAAATEGHAKNLRAVANRIGPAARTNREARILRAAIASQLAERMREELHNARGPLPGLKSKPKKK